MMGMDDIITFREYTKTRGVAKWLSDQLHVSAVLISQWATGIRPIPDDRALHLEVLSGFRLRVERLCPDTRWYRVKDAAWPHGKPLIDKTPIVPKRSAPRRKKPAVPVALV